MFCARVQIDRPSDLCTRSDKALVVSSGSTQKKQERIYKIIIYEHHVLKP